MSCNSTYRVLKGWLCKKPGYVVALVLLFVAVLVGLYLVKEKKTLVENLRHQLRAETRQYEEKRERGKQRLAAVLSHLEANPQVKAPGNHQSLIGPYAKMEWKYGTTENGVDQSSHKYSAVEIRSAQILRAPSNTQSLITPNAKVEWEYSTRDKNASQYYNKHSIVEIRNATTPLKSEKIKVAGEAAWYPIKLSKKVYDSGTFLWRVIEGESDSSRQLRAEGSWGPYSVFAIYPSVYRRIQKTRKIIVGAYNVEQVEFESKDSALKEPCSKSSDGLSKIDRGILCEVIKSKSITEKFGELEPVVKRFSDIDNKLLDSLKAGEIDIAFGDISKARYREERGFHFLEYETSKEPRPMLLANGKNKRKAREIGPNEKICTVRGTVYQYALEKQKRYQSVICQNAFDAIDKLYKNDVQWAVMGSQTWEEINEPKVFPNRKSQLLNRFLGHAGSELMLLTNEKSKVDAEEIGPREKICTVRGTESEHVTEELRKKNQGRYDFGVCQNAFDAIDKLYKNDIQWVVMGSQTWQEVNEPKVFPNEEAKLLKILRNKKKIGDDAFAMTDLKLHDAICLALREIKKDRNCQTLVPPNSQKEEVSSRVGS